MSETISKIRKRLGDFRRWVSVRLPRYSTRDAHEMTMKAKEESPWGRRSEVRQNLIKSLDSMVAQPWSFAILKLYANKHPSCRIVFEAVVDEILETGGEFFEKFNKKCTVCGKKHLKPVDKCDFCGSGKEHLISPSLEQKQRADRFLKDPNRDDEWSDIITGLLMDGMALGNAYLFKNRLAGSRLWEVFVEDGSEMFICADEKARLGNGVYFCPMCFRVIQDGQYVTTFTEKEKDKHQGKCPECGGSLKETAYKHMKQGTSEVTARFAREEIIHFNFDPRPPQLYGESKMIPVLTSLRSFNALMLEKFDETSSGEVMGILGIPGITNEQAREIADSIAEREQQVEIDPYTGRIGRKKRRIKVVGSEEGQPSFTPMRPPSDDAQELEWMKFWHVEMVGGQYGVQPVMMNIPTRTSTGYKQRMQIVVENKRQRKRMRILADNLNQQLFEPDMGITDWEYRFNEIEQKDELGEAQIWMTKLAAARQATELGLDVEITDEGELKVSGKPVLKLAPETGEPPPIKPKVPPIKPVEEGDDGDNP